MINYIWWQTSIQNFSKIRSVVSEELRPQKRDGQTDGCTDRRTQTITMSLRRVAAGDKNLYITVVTSGKKLALQ